MLYNTILHVLLYGFLTPITYGFEYIMDITNLTF